MQDILILNKQVGETPLECMNRFRLEHPEYEGVKMTYAGRLDPMAEGVLLVLAGERVHDKDKYLKLPKTYECTAIIGIGTDTYDILGIPTLSSKLPLTPSWQEGEPNSHVSDAPLTKRSCKVKHLCKAHEALRVTEELSSFVGTFTQQYPPYSSKTVNGKQLHAIARDGELEGLEMPSRQVTVESISKILLGSIAMEDLVKDVTNRISKVTGDFRQHEIVKKWQDLADRNPEKRLTFVTFTISVSGGTYIRGVVHELGKKLEISSCIWKLKRTKVAQFGFSLL